MRQYICVSRKFAENKHWHVYIRGCCRGRWTSHKDRTQNRTKSKSEIRTKVSQTHSSSITARSSKLMLQQKNDIIQFVQEWQWNVMLLKKIVVQRWARSFNTLFLYYFSIVVLFELLVYIHLAWHHTFRDSFKGLRQYFQEKLLKSFEIEICNWRWIYQRLGDDMQNLHTTCAC